MGSMNRNGFTGGFGSFDISPREDWNSFNDGNPDSLEYEPAYPLQVRQFFTSAVRRSVQSTTSPSDEPTVNKNFSVINLPPEILYRIFEHTIAPFKEYCDDKLVPNSFRGKGIRFQVVESTFSHESPFPTDNLTITGEASSRNLSQMAATRQTVDLLATYREIQSGTAETIPAGWLQSEGVAQELEQLSWEEDEMTEEDTDDYSDSSESSDDESSDDDTLDNGEEVATFVPRASSRRLVLSRDPICDLDCVQRAFLATNRRDGDGPTQSHRLLIDPLLEKCCDLLCGFTWALDDEEELEHIFDDIERENNNMFVTVFRHPHDTKPTSDEQEDTDASCIKSSASGEPSSNGSAQSSTPTSSKVSAPSTPLLRPAIAIPESSSLATMDDGIDAEHLDPPIFDDDDDEYSDPLEYVDYDFVMVYRPHIWETDEEIVALQTSRRVCPHSTAYEPRCCFRSPHQYQNVLRLSQLSPGVTKELGKTLYPNCTAEFPYGPHLFPVFAAERAAILPMIRGTILRLDCSADFNDTITTELAYMLSFFSPSLRPNSPCRKLAFLTVKLRTSLVDIPRWPQVNVPLTEKQLVMDKLKEWGPLFRAVHTDEFLLRLVGVRHEVYSAAQGVPYGMGQEDWAREVTNREIRAMWRYAGLLE